MKFEEAVAGAEGREPYATLLEATDAHHRRCEAVVEIWRGWNPPHTEPRYGAAARAAGAAAEAARAAAGAARTAAWEAEAATLEGPLTTMMLAAHPQFAEPRSTP